MPRASGDKAPRVHTSIFSKLSASSENDIVSIARTPGPSRVCGPVTVRGGRVGWGEASEEKKKSHDIKQKKKAACSVCVPRRYSVSCTPSPHLVPAREMGGSLLWREVGGLSQRRDGGKRLLQGRVLSHWKKAESARSGTARHGMARHGARLLRSDRG